MVFRQQNDAECVDFGNLYVTIENTAITATADINPICREHFESGNT